MGCIPSFFFFWQEASLIGPSPKTSKTMETPQNLMILVFKSSSPLAHRYKGKDDNIYQNTWDKSEVLLGTHWRTCWEHGST
jgi:hypothetical protein